MLDGSPAEAPRSDTVTNDCCRVRGRHVTNAPTGISFPLKLTPTFVIFKRIDHGSGIQKLVCLSVQRAQPPWQTAKGANHAACTGMQPSNQISTVQQAQAHIRFASCGTGAARSGSSGGRGTRSCCFKHKRKWRQASRQQLRTTNPAAQHFDSPWYVMH